MRQKRWKKDCPKQEKKDALLLNYYGMHIYNEKQRKRENTKVREQRLSIREENAHVSFFV